MNLIISGNNLKVTNPLKDIINKKCQKLTKHTSQSIISMETTLSVDKDTHIIESTIHTPTGSLFAKSKDNDMYKAIDSMIAKLDKQLKKQKGKHSPDKAKLSTIQKSDIMETNDIDIDDDFLYFDDDSQIASG